MTLTSPALPPRPPIDPPATHSRGRRGAALVVALLLASGCQKAATGDNSAATSTALPTTLRLGYFANLTHAVPVVGIASGELQSALGTQTKIDARTFNAGPAAVEALLTGALDATYVGPNPAVTAYIRSGGRDVRVVAGAASGGAALVVKPGIDGPGALEGKKLATPQRGNTQDVALRNWLGEHNLSAPLEGGGDVTILPQENPQTLDTFRSGAIDGAWVPEPWASRLVVEGGGKVLVEERTLWPDGKFVTTLLLVRTDFLERYPEAVRRLVQGQIATIDLLTSDPARSQKLVNAALQKLTGRALPDQVIAKAWPNLTFTWDPVAPSLVEMAATAEDVGLLQGDVASVGGIFDLGILQDLLAQAGKPKVATE